MAHLEMLLKKNRAAHPNHHRIFIVTDGVFGMDGDFDASTEDIIELAEHYSATVVLDDAHGTGNHGETGKGERSSISNLEARNNPDPNGNLEQSSGCFWGLWCGRQS